MSGEGPLNTKIEGDPASCHETARWLSNVSGDAHDAGTQLHQARSESESSWHGQAGGAFRNHVGGTAKGADDLAERATDVSEALDTFAGELESIKKQVDHVRGQAAEAGLTTTDTQIMPPGPKPGGAPAPLPQDATEETGRAHDQQQAAFSVAFTAHKRKEEAFEEASTTLAQLRERESEAHRSLSDVLKRKSFADTYGTTLLAKATTSIATGHTIAGESIQKLTSKIDDYDRTIASIEKQGASTAAGRLAASTETAALRTSSFNTAERLADMQQVEKATKSMGGGIFAANPGSLIKGESHSAAGKFAKGTLKRLPYAGTLIAGTSAAKGIHDGKPAAKEVEKAVGDTGASIAAGAAVGTMIGGPVGTVIGVGAGWAASYGVDAFVDWKNGPVEQANRALGWE